MRLIDGAADVHVHHNRLNAQLELEPYHGPGPGLAGQENPAQAPYGDASFAGLIQGPPLLLQRGSMDGTYTPMQPSMTSPPAAALPPAASYYSSTYEHGASWPAPANSTTSSTEGSASQVRSSAAATGAAADTQQILNSTSSSGTGTGTPPNTNSAAAQHINTSVNNEQPPQSSAGARHPLNLLSDEGRQLYFDLHGRHVENPSHKQEGIRIFQLMIDTLPDIEGVQGDTADDIWTVARVSWFS